MDVTKLVQGGEIFLALFTKSMDINCTQHIYFIMVTQGRRLSVGTDGHIAVQRKVQELWNMHGPDIAAYPSPAALHSELEQDMTPYGDSHAQRLNKCRTLYNRLLKEIFRSNSKFYSIYNSCLLTQFTHHFALCLFV